MIDFYTWQTSNAQRVAIMLEECALAYRVHKVNLMKGEQRAPEFLQLNPAGAVPVVVDDDGPGGARVTLSQSGAIVLYLAEKTGRFMPADPLRRAQVLQWMMLTLTDAVASSMTIFLLGTMCPEKSPENVSYFEQRLLRYFRIADAQLAESEWLVGELSVADFALYTLLNSRRQLVEGAGDLPHLVRWGAALAARPAVSKAMQPIA